MAISIIILIVVTYYRMFRSAIVCLLCLAILPLDTNYDIEMFFIVWAIFATLVSLTWQFWAAFGIGYLVGKR